MSAPVYNVSVDGNSNDSNVILGSTNGSIVEDDNHDHVNLANKLAVLENALNLNSTSDLAQDALVATNAAGIATNASGVATNLTRLDVHEGLVLKNIDDITQLKNEKNDVLNKLTPQFTPDAQEHIRSVVNNAAALTNEKNYFFVCGQGDERISGVKPIFGYSVADSITNAKTGELFPEENNREAKFNACNNVESIADVNTDVIQPIASQGKMIWNVFFARLESLKLLETGKSIQDSIPGNSPIYPLVKDTSGAKIQYYHPDLDNLILWNVGDPVPDTSLYDDYVTFIKDDGTDMSTHINYPNKPNRIYYKKIPNKNEITLRSIMTHQHGIAHCLFFDTRADNAYGGQFDYLFDYDATPTTESTSDHGKGIIRSRFDAAKIGVTGNGGKNLAAVIIHLKTREILSQSPGENVSGQPGPRPVSGRIPGQGGTIKPLSLNTNWAAGLPDEAFDNPNPDTDYVGQYSEFRDITVWTNGRLVCPNVEYMAENALIAGMTCYDPDTDFMYSGHHWGSVFAEYQINTSLGNTANGPLDTTGSWEVIQKTFSREFVRPLGLTGTFGTILADDPNKLDINDVASRFVPMYYNSASGKRYPTSTMVTNSRGKRESDGSVIHLDNPFYDKDPRLSENMIVPVGYEQLYMGHIDNTGFIQTRDCVPCSGAFIPTCLSDEYKIFEAALGGLNKDGNNFIAPSLVTLWLSQQFNPYKSLENIIPKTTSGYAQKRVSTGLGGSYHENGFYLTQDSDDDFVNTDTYARAPITGLTSWGGANKPSWTLNTTTGEFWVSLRNTLNGVNSNYFPFYSFTLFDELVGKKTHTSQQLIQDLQIVDSIPSLINVITNVNQKQITPTLNTHFGLVSKNIEDISNNNKLFQDFKEQSDSKFLNSADKYLLERHINDNNRKKEINITPLATPQYVTPVVLVNPRKLYIFDDNFSAVNGLVSLFNNGYTNKWNVVRDMEPLDNGNIKLINQTLTYPDAIDYQSLNNLMSLLPQTDFVLTYKFELTNESKSANHLHLNVEENLGGSITSTVLNMGLNSNLGLLSNSSTSLTTTTDLPLNVKHELEFRKFEDKMRISVNGTQVLDISNTALSGAINFGFIGNNNVIVSNLNVNAIEHHVKDGNPDPFTGTFLNYMAKTIPGGDKVIYQYFQWPYLNAYNAPVLYQEVFSIGMEQKLLLREPQLYSGDPTGAGLPDGGTINTYDINMKYTLSTSSFVPFLGVNYWAAFIQATDSTDPIKNNVIKLDPLTNEKYTNLSYFNEADTRKLTTGIINGREHFKVWTLDRKEDKLLMFYAPIYDEVTYWNVTEYPLDVSGSAISGDSFREHNQTVNSNKYLVLSSFVDINAGVNNYNIHLINLEGPNIGKTQAFFNYDMTSLETSFAKPYLLALKVEEYDDKHYFGIATRVNGASGFLGPNEKMPPGNHYNQLWSVSTSAIEGGGDILGSLSKIGSDLPLLAGNPGCQWYSAASRCVLQQSSFLGEYEIYEIVAKPSGETLEYKCTITEPNNSWISVGSKFIFIGTAQGPTNGYRSVSIKYILESYVKEFLFDETLNDPNPDRTTALEVRQPFPRDKTIFTESYLPNL